MATTLEGPGSILVTGAAGFVGQHLMATLRRRIPQTSVLEAAFDVTDAAGVLDAVASARPDAVVHLAAVAAPAEARRDPDVAWRVNLGGTLNLARAIQQAAPACLLLFASTADAYGTSFASGAALDESAPLAPLNAYGATKAAADLALGAMAAEGLRCVRFRPFNHTGPGQSEAFAVPAFARQVARIEAGLQEPVLDVGALDAERDFLDVRDVCEAYVSALVLADDLPHGAVLNLASGRARRIGDVLQDLLDAAGLRAEVRTDPARLRPSDIQVAVGDARRARAVLDWMPLIPWEVTVRDVLDDWRGRVG